MIDGLDLVHHGRHRRRASRRRNRQAGMAAQPVRFVLALALNRDDSAWYPTMRLFRQSGPGDWGEVIERVAAALPEFHSFE